MSATSWWSSLPATTKALIVLSPIVLWALFKTRRLAIEDTEEALGIEYDETEPLEDRIAKVEARKEEELDRIDREIERLINEGEKNELRDHRDNIERMYDEVLEELIREWVE